MSDKTDTRCACATQTRSALSTYRACADTAYIALITLCAPDLVKSVALYRASVQIALYFPRDRLLKADTVPEMTIQVCRTSPYPDPWVEGNWCSIRRFRNDRGGDAIFDICLSAVLLRWFHIRCFIKIIMGLLWSRRSPRLGVKVWPVLVRATVPWNIIQTFWISLLILLLSFTYAHNKITINTPPINL